MCRTHWSSNQKETTEGSTVVQHPYFFPHLQLNFKHSHVEFEPVCLLSVKGLYPEQIVIHVSMVISRRLTNQYVYRERRFHTIFALCVLLFPTFEVMQRKHAAFNAFLTASARHRRAQRRHSCQLCETDDYRVVVITNSPSRFCTSAQIASCTCQREEVGGKQVQPNS